MSSRVEDFARNLDPETTKSVRAASAAKVSARITALATAFKDPDDAREQARQIKDHVLDNLEALLDQLEAKCEENGIQVHRAKDADSANAIILDICRRVAPDGRSIAKAKSMATEEIHLNKHLEKAGYQPIETDLGEFVVQIDDDTPSHIITPIIHKNRRQIAESFEREGLGPYTEVPEELAGQARKHLRQKFKEAKIGISGINFAIASTGRLVIVENEGNNRLSTTAPRVHIALMGIEKLLLRDEDLALFLPLLTCSATGQAISTYVHMVSGPRRSDELDGPDEVHLVLLDNGRRQVLNGPYREILRCIRCGACLNVCPVYRQASGHAYDHVYSGPLGAVLAPALEGVKVMGDLASASSLCGACEEVCPVKIPIPDMLLRLRDEGFRSGVSAPPWRPFATVATRPTLWRTGLKLLPLASHIPTAPTKAWAEFRQAPQREGRDFRSWWRGRAESDRLDKSDELDELGESVPRVQSVQPRALLEESLSALGARCITHAEYEKLTQKKRWADPCLNLQNTAETVWEAEVGFSHAIGGIADTGTLIVASGQDAYRLSSLVPPVNVVVVNRNTIFQSLEDALPSLPTSNIALISGPSRTADIEGVLVRGVHGPGELLVYVRDE